MSSLPYFSPHTRLKIAKDVAPNIFDEGVRVARYHIAALELLEKRYARNIFVIFRDGSKSTILNKVYLFTEILKNKEKFTLIVSKTNKKAAKIISDIRRMFEASIVKGYPVAKGTKWTDTHLEIIVEGVYTCTIVAVGAGEDPRGENADFSRPTLIMVDDLESKKGRYPVKKAKYRREMEDWFYGDLIPSLDTTIGRVIFLGTIIHKDAIVSKLLRDKEYHHLNIPIIRDGKSAWPSRKPLKLIYAIRAAYEKNNDLSTFYREYMNRPVADEKVLFKEKYFKYFSHVKYLEGSLRREVGNEIEQISMLIRTPESIVLDDGTEIPVSACTVHTIMDIADAGVEGDRTAMVTCATYDSKRYVLEIKSGYWSPHEKGVRLMETYLTFRPRYVGIEIGPMYRDLRASIDVLLKKEGIDIPIEPISHGGVAKNTRIANLQPAFVDGRYYFNKDDPNTIVVEGQLSSFDESADSDEDDEMDALAYHETTNNLMFQDDYDDDDDDDGGMYAAR